MRREPGATYNSRALIDACKPFDWIDEFPLPSAESSPEYLDSIINKWRHVFPNWALGSVDRRGRNSYAESMMATICASGGFDEYCDPAG